MTSSSDWLVPPAARPHSEDYSFDLNASLSAVVGIKTLIPDDAFTAEILGTERSGNGVLIRADGLVLTIGYLITEAQEIWLTLHDGRTVPGHVVGYDQATGFGLVQALEKLDLQALPLGQSGTADVGTNVVLAGAGGLECSVAAQVVGKQEFAGYWEYVLDDALFTAPAHPHWGGTALIGNAGELLGIGSLQLESQRDNQRETINMVVPIDLLRPILDDMITLGRPDSAHRPWLGLYASEIDQRITIMGTATGSPANKAELQSGDVILAVAEKPVDELADFFRKIWALGDAGVEVPFKVWRDGDTFDVVVNSSDRDSFLKRPQLH